MSDDGFLQPSNAHDPGAQRAKVAEAGLPVGPLSPSWKPAVYALLGDPVPKLLKQLAGEFNAALQSAEDAGEKSQRWMKAAYAWRKKAEQWEKEAERLRKLIPGPTDA